MGFVDSLTHTTVHFNFFYSDNDEKAITAMGLLNTMETILTVMEDHAVHARLEPVVLQAVHHIFTNSIMEFYEEALSLTYDLTTTKISNGMWEMLKIIYKVSICIRMCNSKMCPS